MTIDGPGGPAHIAIRHDVVRTFWFERIGSERVAWSSFWTQLFSWIQARPAMHSCAVFQSLNSEQALRERCQQVMVQMSLGHGSQNSVSAADLNLVFIPNVPLPTRLSQLVKVARKACSPGALHSSVLQQAHVHHVVSKTPSAVYSSEQFGEPQELDLELHQTISEHVSNLDKCCKSLSAASGCTRQRTDGSRADFTAGCLSLDPESVSDDTDIQSSAYLASLGGALAHVRAKLLALRTALQLCTASEASSSRQRILSVVGPPLSGKSSVARALAVRMSCAHQTDTISQAKGVAKACRGSDSVQPVAGSVVVVQLGQCHSLEESLQALGTKLGARAYTRDVCAVLGLVQRGSVVLLDNVDLMPCQHAADLVRLLLHFSQVASIVVTSCSPKLKTSGRAALVDLRPWHMGLCFAYAMSHKLKSKDVKWLARCSKGMPGLLARCLALVADAHYRNSLLRLYQNDNLSSDTHCKIRHQPSHFVWQIQRACWETAAATESKPVLALVSACRAHAHSVPLPLAASIAHKDCGVLSDSAISSTQGAHGIEDLAMNHLSMSLDRPAGNGYASCSIRSLATIAVSCGLHSSALSERDGAGTSMNTRGSSVSSNSPSRASVGQHLARAVSLGLLDISTLESGNRLSCPHAGLMNREHASSGRFPPTITQKYAASIVQLVCSLHYTAPETAAALLQQYSDVIWQSLAHMRSRRSIECMYDIFPLLSVLYHSSSIERLLLKALAAAQLAGVAWYAKVLVCCSKMQQAHGVVPTTLSWTDLQAAVNSAFPHPSYTSISLLLCTPLESSIPGCCVEVCEESTRRFLESGKPGACEDATWRALLLCDWSVLQARKLLNDGTGEACVAHGLRHTLHSRQAILSDAHPSVWEHMTVLAMALHKCGDHYTAHKVMQQVVKSQASALLDTNAQLLYSQQYLAHLAFSCKSPQSSQSIVLQWSKLVASEDTAGARAVTGRNLLVHLQDYDAAVQCLLPVFQRWCKALAPPTRCNLTDSCLHMLMVALLELSLLEACEHVALAVLQTVPGALQDGPTHNECTSHVYLICLAVHNFNIYDVAPTKLARFVDFGGVNHVAHYAWQLLARAYLKAGLLLEAGAASSKAISDVDSLLIKGSVMFEAGNQELSTVLQQIKKASVPERLSYQFHMLHAAALLRQEQPKVALEELELAELADHSDGKQQGDLFRLKAACLSKLERHDLAKERLFQSSVVVMQTHGESSLVFGMFLETVAAQLMRENKLKRASAMLHHALSIFSQALDQHIGAVGQLRCLSLLAGGEILNMRVSDALKTAGDALVICKNSLWPHTTGERVAYHLHCFWTAERLQATEKQSALCKTIQSSMQVGNTKLHGYSAKCIAQVAAQAFVAHSRACSDMEVAMTSACNAVLCTSFATQGQGAVATLAWCQVCTCATMRLLQKQGHKWRILQPWHVQPSLSHHALTECICEHALPRPAFRKRMTTIFRINEKRDLGALHDDTEAVYLQLLREVPFKGVEDMGHPSVKHLWKRCKRNLGKHRQVHPAIDLQMQLVFGYLLFLEADYASAARHLAELVQRDSSSAYSFCIQVEAMCLLAAAYSLHSLADQAADVLHRTLAQLQSRGAAHQGLQQVHQQWCCVVLHQLAVIYDGPLNRPEMGESCWRQCMVALYTTNDNGSCANVLARLAGCIWKRLLVARDQHAPAPQLPTGWQPSLQNTSKVALGQAVSSEVIAAAARGGPSELRVIHNTCVSLLWRALGLLQKDDSPAWSICGCLIFLAELFREGFSSPAWGLDAVTCMVKALDCSKQAVAIMGLNLEGSRLAVSDVSMHTELERVVLHAALQFHVDVQSAAKLSWESIHSSGSKMEPRQATALTTALSTSKRVKAQFMLASSQVAGDCAGRAQTLLQLGETLSQLFQDDEVSWKHFDKVLRPYLVHEVKQWLSTWGLSTGKKQCSDDLLHRMQSMQHSLNGRLIG